ncbi:MAG: hypothetical protein ACRDJH_25735 [Thermomicrobiales bacterium]
MAREKTLASVHLAELTPWDIRRGGFDTAVLPIGATEFHGDHFPNARLTGHISAWTNRSAFSARLTASCRMATAVRRRR